MKQGSTSILIGDVLERLVRERDEAQDAVRAVVRQRTEAEAQRNAALAVVGELTEAGWHSGRCSFTFSGGNSCDCGWHAALASAAALREKATTE